MSREKEINFEKKEGKYLKLSVFLKNY